MKPAQSISSRQARRFFTVAVIVTLASVTACKRETPVDSSAAKPPAETTKRVSDNPPSVSALPKPAVPKSADLQKLIGRWIRTDSPYVIEIKSTKDDGTLEAAYYNPRPINVGQARASQTSQGLKVFVELRDVNYPGSTYTLTYDRENDSLQGVYFQATMQQSYDIAFMRQQPPR